MCGRARSIRGFAGLNVDGRRLELVAFLEALNDDEFDRTVPERGPSGLPVGGRISDDQPRAAQRPVSSSIRMR